MLWCNGIALQSARAKHLDVRATRYMTADECKTVAAADACLSANWQGWLADIALDGVLTSYNTMLLHMHIPLRGSLKQIIVAVFLLRSTS